MDFFPHYGHGWSAAQQRSLSIVRLHYHGGAVNKIGALWHLGSLSRHDNGVSVALDVVFCQAGVALAPDPFFRVSAIIGTSDMEAASSSVYGVCAYNGNSGLRESGADRRQAYEAKIGYQRIEGIAGRFLSAPRSARWLCIRRASGW